MAIRSECLLLALFIWSFCISTVFAGTNPPKKTDQNPKNQITVHKVNGISKKNKQSRALVFDDKHFLKHKVLVDFKKEFDGKPIDLSTVKVYGKDRPRLVTLRAKGEYTDTRVLCLNKQFQVVKRFTTHKDSIVVEQNGKAFVATIHKERSAVNALYDNECNVKMRFKDVVEFIKEKKTQRKPWFGKVVSFYTTSDFSRSVFVTNYHRGFALLLYDDKGNRLKEVYKRGVIRNEERFAISSVEASPSRKELAYLLRRYDSRGSWDLYLVKARISDLKVLWEKKLTSHKELMRKKLAYIIDSLNVGEKYMAYVFGERPRAGRRSDSRYTLQMYDKSGRLLWSKKYKKSVFGQFLAGEERFLVIPDVLQTKTGHSLNRMLNGYTGIRSKLTNGIYCLQSWKGNDKLISSSGVLKASISTVCPLYFSGNSFVYGSSGLSSIFQWTISKRMQLFMVNDK